MTVCFAGNRRVRDTSLESYLEIQPRILTMQQLVYNAVKQNPESTALEIADSLGFKDPNHVRPRITELADFRFIVDAGVRRCRISGRNAHTWRAAK